MYFEYVGRLAKGVPERRGPEFMVSPAKQKVWNDKVKQHLLLDTQYDSVLQFTSSTLLTSDSQNKASFEVFFDPETQVTQLSQVHQRIVFVHHP